MLNLEKRIAALEGATPADNEVTFIRRYVSPDHLNEPINHLFDDEGNQWARQPDETQDAFTDRASKEVRHNSIGVGFLTAGRECDLKAKRPPPTSRPSTN